VLVGWVLVGEQVRSIRRFNADEPHAIGGVSQTDDGRDSVLDEASVVLGRTTGREILGIVSGWVGPMLAGGTVGGNGEMLEV
jgi:hypothetical protein